MALVWKDMAVLLLEPIGAGVSVVRKEPPSVRRPTEFGALFSILGSRLPDSRFCDLYAGERER